MEEFWLRVRAPFAAFRGMQAGAFRTTAPVMPPSAALGLVLNLAAIESRDPTPRPTTRTAAGIPCMQIAVGLMRPPVVTSLYQQLHEYPVGNSGKELAARTHGAKYWIKPVRRQLLVDYDGVIGIRTGERTLIDRTISGLRGAWNAERYGVPFAGDNNLFFDRIEVLEAPPSAFWYERLGPDDPPRLGSCRLTVGIDREDSSRTTVPVFAPTAEARPRPGDLAWTWTPHEPAA